MQETFCLRSNGDLGGLDRMGSLKSPVVSLAVPLGYTHLRNRAVRAELCSVGQ